jgi:hypothetical protein
MGAIIIELHSNWKHVVLTKLQLSRNELHLVYIELELYNSYNLFVNIHNV